MAFKGDKQINLLLTWTRPVWISIISLSYSPQVIWELNFTDLLSPKIYVPSNEADMEKQYAGSFPGVSLNSGSPQVG